jgi:CheY-like chemotaxis protein
MIASCQPAVSPDEGSIAKAGDISLEDDVSLESDDLIRPREPVLALLSHEMRTPLNGVLGMAGLLAATKLDATQQAYLSALRDSGELLLGLVNDILDLAKLDSRPLELEPVDVDVERLLQGVCELLSPRAYAAGIEIAWSTQGLLPRLRADDGRLRQILFNLAGNAIKLTPAGGVLVTASKVADADDKVRVRFSVKDTGPGVAEAFQARIFEAFVQTEAGARAGGAGLGLAIVRRLATAFQGELGLDSPPGEGAHFWFEADFALAALQPDGAAAPSLATAPLAGRRVAVISANPIVRQAAQMQVETCGGQVVERPFEHPSAVAVLVDPDPNAAPLPPPVPAPSIVLLAPEARDRIEAYRAAGYAGYLIKPLRRASLAARVLAVLGEAGVQPTPVAGSRATGEDERGEDERADDERALVQSAEGLRVLLAEDNPINALLARALLTRAGCVVDRAATGQEALTALEAAPYDLVLMDMRMPGMDGPTAARTLRGRGDRTPIIALTANAFDDDRRTCLESGMDDFLTKPLEPKALQAALARWGQKCSRS